MTVTRGAALVDHIESLPPLPAIVHRVLSVTESSDSSADEVAQVLSEDQAFAAKILRVANSSFFGAGRQVTEVSRAVLLLGMVGVRNMVLGIAARDAFPSTATPTTEHATLWRHSIAVASASEAIARHVRYRPSEEAFVTGLLHDIGQLAMVTFAPESFREAFSEHRQGMGFLAAEREHFGIDHTEAGFEILTRWGLPESMCRVVRWHHEQEIDPDDPSARLLAVVMSADTIAQVMGFGFDMPVGKLHRAESSVRYLGLSETEQLRVLNGLTGRIDEAVEMFVNIDMAEHQKGTRLSKRAVWVDSGDVTRSCISQLLLEHCGYEVMRVSPFDLDEQLSLDDFVLVASSEDGSAENLACNLVQRGHEKVVLLSDPEGEAASRRWDKATGVYHIARVFTAFDIRWVEEHAGHG